MDKSSQRCTLVENSMKIIPLLHRFVLSVNIIHVSGWTMTTDTRTTPLFQASIPFAVVGSNQQIEAKGKKVRGRLYPWGVVEVENPEHNDFLKLRIMLMWVAEKLEEATTHCFPYSVKFSETSKVTLRVKLCVYAVTETVKLARMPLNTMRASQPLPVAYFLSIYWLLTFPQPHRTHMQDLQEVTQDLHYENFRSERLKQGGRLSSHGYILPLSPAYVLVCQLASLHLPHLKQQTSD